MILHVTVMSFKSLDYVDNALEEKSRMNPAFFILVTCHCEKGILFQIALNYQYYRKENLHFLY